MTAFRAIELILSFLTYTGFTWAAFFFFKAHDSSSRLAKKIVSACGAISVSACLFFNFTSPTPAPSRLCFSLLLFLLANSFFWWAYATSRSRALDFVFSKSTPDFLLQSGAYRYVRHPFYFSYICAWLGAWLASDTWWLLMVPVGMALLYVVAAHTEEKVFMENPLSSDYSEYRRRTPMFIPFAKLFTR